MGLTAPGTEYVLKVVRDKPIEHYKWGAYPGRESVMAK